MMKNFMRYYGGFVRMFLALGLVILVLAALVMYSQWEFGKWPVVKSFQSPNADCRVEVVDWDTEGFFQTGKGSLVSFRHDSGSFGGPYNWEDIDVQWAPDGANLFLTIVTVEGETEYRIVEQKSGENPDGVGSWGSRAMIPRKQEPDLQVLLTEICKAYPGFPKGWERISYLFVGWGEDSETLTFGYQTDREDFGFLDYHYPSGEITDLYQ